VISLETEIRSTLIETEAASTGVASGTLRSGPVLSAMRAAVDGRVQILPNRFLEGSTFGPPIHPDRLGVLNEENPVILFEVPEPGRYLLTISVAEIVRVWGEYVTYAADDDDHSNSYINFPDSYNTIKTVLVDIDENFSVNLAWDDPNYHVSISYAVLQRVDSTGDPILYTDDIARVILRPDSNNLSSGVITRVHGRSIGRVTISEEGVMTEDPVSGTKWIYFYPIGTPNKRYTVTWVVQHISIPYIVVGEWYSESNYISIGVDLSEGEITATTAVGASLFDYSIEPLGDNTYKIVYTFSSSIEWLYPSLIPRSSRFEGGWILESYLGSSDRSIRLLDMTIVPEGVEGTNGVEPEKVYSAAYEPTFQLEEDSYFLIPGRIHSFKGQYLNDDISGILDLTREILGVAESSSEIDSSTLDVVLPTAGYAPVRPADWTFPDKTAYAGWEDGVEL
jgi:hypothetical protein